MKSDFQYSQSVYETLKLAYRPFTGAIALSLIFGFLGRIVILANTNIIGYWVDHREEFPFEKLIILLAGLSTFGFILTLYFRISFSRLSAKAVSLIYDEVTIRTSRYPLSFFDNNTAGKVITRFSSDYGNVFRLFGGPLAEFFAIIFDLIAMIILITLASPYYLPIVVIIILMNYSIYKSNSHRLREARRKLSSSRSPSIAHFAETAQGASTIRTFNKEQSFYEKFNFFDNQFLNEKINTSKVLLNYSLKLNSLTAILLLLTGAFAYLALENDIITVGSLGVAFAFIVLSGSTVQMFFEWMGQFEEAMVGMERLDNYLRRPLEKGAKLPASRQFQTNHDKYSTEEESALMDEVLTSHLNARVSFQNLWFRYEENQPFILKDINLEIKAGERLGIIGRTGSGKSSLIQALFHFYPISDGCIKIAGKSPIVDVDLEVYRKSLSYISQDSILFSGTLRENLDIDNHFSDDFLCNILNQVGLSEWATTQKLNSIIQEKGRNLSLGEKQLICVARCLLQNAPVVILDEATSSIDPQSEALLTHATDKLFAGKTQIIIAHRLSTLEKCDRILWLDQGSVKMIGTPKEILHSFQDQ